MAFDEYMDEDKSLRDLAAAIINISVFDYHEYQQRSSYENWQFGRECSVTRRRGVVLRRFFDSGWFEGLLFMCAPDLDADYLRQRIYSGQYNAHAGKRFLRHPKKKT